MAQLTDPVPDFLAAMLRYLALAPGVAAISPEIYFGVAPPGPVWPDGEGASGSDGYYPVAVVAMLGGRASGLNTGPGYWEENNYEFAAYHPDLDQAVTNAKTMRSALNRLKRNPLAFTDGYQMTVYPMGQSTLKIPGFGPLASSYVWRQCYTYRARVGQQ